MTRAGRIACVTGGLVGAGAVFGGIAGGVALWIALALSGGAPFNDPGILLVGAYFGAPIGSVVLPAFAWVLLRRVALGRVIALSVAGTVAGGVLGWAIRLGGNAIVGGLKGAVLGFVIAAVSMWLAERRSPRPGALRQP